MNPSAKSSDRFRRPRAFALLWAVLLLSPLVAASPDPTPPGVVVEEVSAGSTLAKAGIRADDVLLAWERLPRPAAGSDAGAGELASPFDWEWLKIEEAPRGAIKLYGEHQGKRRVLTVEIGPWVTTVHPRIFAEPLATYLEGRDLIERGELEAGIGRWRQVAEAAGDWRLRCWVWWRIGELRARARSWDAAQAAYRRALAHARDPRSRVVVWDAVAQAFEQQRQWERAQTAHHSALRIRETGADQRLGMAKTRNALGNLALSRGDLKTAKIHHQAAFDVRQRLAPESLEITGSLHNLGIIALFDSDLASAEEHFRSASKLLEKLAPNSLRMGNNHNNLGNVALVQGDLVRAEDHLQRALDIFQKLAPRSLDLAYVLNNLGNIAQGQGDLMHAKDYYERALDIKRELAPDTLAFARTLDNLAFAMGGLGELQEAKACHLEAQEIFMKEAPESLDMAGSLNNLGLVEYDLGNVARAQAHYELALYILENLTPNSLSAASAWANLGTVAGNQGDEERAIECSRRALTIYQKLAPNSTYEALALHQMGMLFYNTKRLEQAADHMDRALRSLETQIAMLGGSHRIQGGFRAQYPEVYRDYLRVLLELNRGEQAFHVVERSRARSLLAMLTERDPLFTADVPAELASAQERIAQSHDHVLRRLAILDADRDGAQVEALSAEMASLDREREQIRASIRQASPRLAALRYPEPLSVGQVQEMLDPGTVLLSYSVGKQRTHLFVVTRDAGLVEVKTLELGEDQLRQKIDDFRYYIAQTSSPESQLFSSMKEVGHELYRDLMAEVAEHPEAGERILIIPDGPLHLLPFGALIRESAESPADGKVRYLAEWKPLHTVVSATLFAELKRTRPQGEARQPPVRIAGFGDPLYPNGHPRFKALPYSGREINGITDLYPPETVEKHLGEDATEEQAKALDRSIQILHFAVHGLVDDRNPLDSHLALTIPLNPPEDGDNGRLEAWEVFEEVRVDAELVVLSACSTGLGEERWGEGLIGLTRAFQYAGARTVAATLWPVPDQVTAELMVRFHRHLRTGKPKDLALRDAQIELIRGPIELESAAGKRSEKDVSVPVYWAAFQLYGDWR